MIVHVLVSMALSILMAIVHPYLLQSWVFLITKFPMIKRGNFHLDTDFGSQAHFNLHAFCILEHLRLSTLTE